MSWRKNNGRSRTDIDGIMWVLEGPSSEVNCVPRRCICPKDATGPQGPTGINGLTGPAGDGSGPTGPTGPVGNNGSNGLTGPQGQGGGIGPTGQTGIQGFTGQQGVTGPAGSAASMGPTGPTGPDGDVGLQGFTGPTGADGLTGPVGFTGQIGTPGSIGVIGPQGFTGPTGPSYGITGITGIPSDPVLQYDVANQYVYYGVKTFVIDHPLQTNKYLVHACLEGPEAGVYYRGSARINTGYNSAEIYLADYVEKLATEFTVYVTPTINGSLPRIYFPKLLTSSICNGKFTVYSNISPCEFAYLVMGKRQAIEVEPEKALVEVKGEGPYKWL